MPFVGPTKNLTTTQRNALAVADRPTGMIIWNTTTSQLEVNSGTGASPTWIAVTASTWDTTYTPRANYLASFSTFSASYVTTGLTVTIPANGNYVVEWGAGNGGANNQGGQVQMSINLPSIGTYVAVFGNVGNTGTSVVKEFTGLAASQVITAYALCTGGPTYAGSLTDLWVKYQRFA